METNKQKTEIAEVKTPERKYYKGVGIVEIETGQIVIVCAGKTIVRNLFNSVDEAMNYIDKNEMETAIAASLAINAQAVSILEKSTARFEDMYEKLNKIIKK